MGSVRQWLKYAGIAVLAIAILLLVAYLLGIIGVPSVSGVENRFGAVNTTDTVIETDLAVHNPNPVGIRLGETSVNYTIRMNDIAMAQGHKRGLNLGAGDSTLEFTTYLQNERIPDWWYTHVEGGEVTEVLVDANLSAGFLFGRTFAFETNETIRTDILGGFNSTETRQIDAGAPLISDPVLYLNETAGWFGENVTRRQTPIETAFTVYNPKPFPYTVTEIGYDIRMNEVRVGTGSTERPYTIMPGQTTTLGATTSIVNDNLDEWWVSHIQNDQVTELVVDFYLVVQPDIDGREIPAIRVDVDSFDYATTIETDLFGNKADTSDGGDGGSGDDTGSGDGGGSDGGGDGTGAGGSGDGGETATDPGPGDGDTTTVSPTPTDDGGLLDGNGSDETTTDDGGLLGSLPVPFFGD